MKIIIVVGTRPQFIKISPLIKVLNQENVDYILVNTGQHYDNNLSSDFFNELKIIPNYELKIESKNQDLQIAEIILKLNKIIINETPDKCIVMGDCNTTLAAAISACKNNIPVYHIESGVRCFDLSVSEEMNRVLVDHCSSVLFCPTYNSEQNLLNEGINKSKIRVVGDLLYDLFISVKDKLPTINFNFIYMTLHRRELLNRPYLLQLFFDQLPSSTRIKFPCHPHTRSVIKKNNIKISDNVTVMDPISYFDSLVLTSTCSFVITDSGGVQREAYYLNKPCAVILDRTTWPEILSNTCKLIKLNEIINMKNIITEIQNSEVFNLQLPYHDGLTSYRILNKIIDD